MDPVAAQIHKLDTMPLSGDDLQALTLVRRTIYSYGALFGLMGAGCGVAISGSPASRPWRVFSAALFGAIGGFLGLSLGLQRGLIRLSDMGGPLSVELNRLDEIKARIKRRGTTDDAAWLDGLFDARLKKGE